MLKISKYVCGLAVLFFVALLTPSLALAEWLRAETDNFVVIGDTSESRISTVANKLELYRKVLHRFTNVTERDNNSKLHIYIVKNNDDIKKISPNIGKNIAGIFFHNKYESVALSTMIEDDFNDYFSVIAHEYYHYFMYSETPGYYPPWVSEGLAEYFSEIKFTKSTIDFGLLSKSRGYAIMNSKNMPIGKLIDKNIKNRGNEFYAQSWLLTHYFMSDDLRKKQFYKYIALVQEGKNSIEAMEIATGEALENLQKNYEKYKSARLVAWRLQRGNNFPDTNVTITELDNKTGKLYVDTVIYNLYESRNIDWKDGTYATLLEEAKVRARPLQNTKIARQLLISYMILEDRYDEADAALAAALKEDPDNLDLLHMQADILMTKAQEAQDNEQENQFLAQARQVYGKITKIDPNNGKAFIRYLEAIRNTEKFTSENSENVAWLALELLPHSDYVRRIFSIILSQRGKYEDAIYAVKPLASGGHDTRGAHAASKAIEHLKQKKPLSFRDWSRFESESAKSQNEESLNRLYVAPNIPESSQKRHIQ